MEEIVQSAWGIIYYIASDGDPRYLLIKRHALSWKIEWVAPKGKIQEGETEKETALRELQEETWLLKEQLVVKQLLWTTSLRSKETKKGHLNKDVTYFLMEYKGDPNAVKIIEWEWYISIYKRATISEVINLIYYEDIRELIRDSYFMIKKEQKNQTVKQAFMSKL